MSSNKLAIPRLMHFIAMLKENRYPNHPRLVAEMRKLDVAGAYDITQKTIQRDVNYLKNEYNAPIAYDFKERGYYLTNKEWNLDAPAFNKDEMDAVIFGTRIAETLVPNPVSGKIRKAMDSLMATGDYQTESGCSSLLSLIATGSRTPIKPEIFEEIFKGWQTRHVLQMNYTRAKDNLSSELFVEPHALAFHEGAWYMRVRMLRSDRVAYEQKNVITLAVHRVRSVTITPCSFQTDPEILKAINSGRIFDFPMLKNVVLKLTGKGITYGPESFRYESAKKEADGSLILYIPEVEEYKIRNFVLTWAGNAEIIAPEELRNQIAEYAKTIYNLHKNP